MKVLVVFVAFLALVWGRKGFGPGEQEWGYAEVRPGAHMFWWLYYITDKTVSKPEDRPLVLWLQGGPGGSGTGFGNFKEFGPLDEDLNPRNYTWVKDCNVLFIDNPVGTGFSYVDSNTLLARDNKQIAIDLVEMMRQFYKALPQFKNTHTYITSESYGGKMTAEFGLEFYRAIKAGTIQANLKGVGLGDSWISPIDSVLTWAPYLLELGAVDIDGYNDIDTMARKTKKALDAGQFVQATNLWSQTEGVVMDATDGIDFYNVLTKIQGFGRKKHTNVKILPGVQHEFSQRFIDDVMNRQVKQALGLPDKVHWSESSGVVFNALSGDFMKPVTNIVESLLNETNLMVAVYTGQLDLIVDTPGTYDWVNRLNWADKNKWNTAIRKSIVANGIIEGYKKEFGKFGMYWVNRAGHMVPADNPAAMNEILKILTNNYQGRGMNNK